MKNIYLCIAVFAAALFAAPSLAEEERRGFYVAPEIGHVTLQDYCKTVRSNVAAVGAAPSSVVTGGVASCSDGEIGYGAAAGYWFNNFVAVEVGGRFASGYDFAVTGTITTPAATVNTRGETDLQTFSIGGRAVFFRTQYFNLGGRAGVHFWEQDVKITGVPSVGGTPIPTPFLRSSDGTDLYFGLNVGYDFNERMGVAAEYTRFVGDANDADVIGASFIINF